MHNLKYLGVTLCLWIVTILICFAISPGSLSPSFSPTESPVLTIAFALYAIQWLGFIPAYLFQTERYYDLLGSVSYVTAIIITTICHPQLAAEKYLLAAPVVIWAARLGSFLFARVIRSNGDARFDTIKTHAIRFFMVWNIQGLWVFLTLAGVLTALHSSENYQSVVDYSILAVGLLVWLAGFIIEVIADRQKSAFKQKPENKGQFIQHGLWSKSRHPNYFGEILLWAGITLAAAPLFSGWQWLGLISPIFVYLLITRLSGLPMLEAKADKNWGDQADYQAYKANTPALWLKL
jgi:steroid 5-alpha reductase family enzyme